MANVTAQLKRGISRQFSAAGTIRRTFNSFKRQSSLDPRRNAARFSFGRQSSLDPIRRDVPGHDEEDIDVIPVPEHLDTTMQLLFLACRGEVQGIEDLLNEGIDVNSIDLDGRTALHIAACEGHIQVVELLLSRKANIDARDRWGSTAAADAKYYGNVEVYNILRARGAKVPKTRRTPMAVTNPREVPEYELNPLELQVRKSDCVAKGAHQVAKWNGTKVSVKILDKDSYRDPETISAFKHELTLLEKVRHPNLVQFVGAVTQNIPMMLVSEYHAKGDLGSYIQNKGRLTPSKTLRFALDIARGMNYLHECKPDPIIHCDLKPKCQKYFSRQWRPLEGPYVAPEIYKDEIFDRSVDSFSFGLVLYEMIEGIQPFHPKSPEEAAEIMCMEGKRPAFRAKSKTYPPELKELIEECWDVKSVVRPTFSEIIVRLDKIVTNSSKQGWWKDTFKLPWK